MLVTLFIVLGAYLEIGLLLWVFVTVTNMAYGDFAKPPARMILIWLLAFIARDLYNKLI